MRFSIRPRYVRRWSADADVVPRRAHHARDLGPEQRLSTRHGRRGRLGEVRVDLELRGQRVVPDLARLLPRVAAPPAPDELDRPGRGAGGDVQAAVVVARGAVV